MTIERELTTIAEYEDFLAQNPDSIYELIHREIPDVSVHLTEEPAVARGAVSGMPDLAVEIKSPTNTIIELREKVTYYLENGCRMVWIVYPDKHFVEIYQLEQDIEILITGKIIKGLMSCPILN
jgi:Uma2 family endonuclease